MCRRRYNDMSELLVGEELNRCIGEYPDEGRGVSSKEPTHTGLSVDVAHGGHDAKPRSSVFGELWVGRLEEDLDPVEGTDHCLGLLLSQRIVYFSERRKGIQRILPVLQQGLS